MAKLHISANENDDSVHQKNLLVKYTKVKILFPQINHKKSYKSDQEISHNHKRIIATKRLLKSSDQLTCFYSD